MQEFMKYHYHPTLKWYYLLGISGSVDHRKVLVSILPKLLCWGPIEPRFLIYLSNNKI